MVLNEWKYAFDRVLQWSKWDGEKKQTQFCFWTAAVFFQTTESSLEMKAIKKTNLFKFRFVLFVFLLKHERQEWSFHQRKTWSFAQCEAALRCVYSFDLQVASLIKMFGRNHSVCTSGYGYTCGSPLPPMWWKQKILSHYDDNFLRKNISYYLKIMTLYQVMT